jgi:hypothetical protein
VIGSKVNKKFWLGGFFYSEPQEVLLSWQNLSALRSVFAPAKHGAAAVGNLWKKLG